jgi:hypothetical protein
VKGTTRPLGVREVGGLARTLLLLYAASGCSEGSPGYDNVRIATWWGHREAASSSQAAVKPVSNSETAAFETLTRALAGVEPIAHVTAWRVFVDASASASVGSPAAPYADKIELTHQEAALLPEDSESPVHALLINGGDDPRRYSCAAGSPMADRAADVTEDVANVSFIEGLLDETSRCAGDNRVFAIPIGVHQLNTLFVNVTKLCEYHTDNVPAFCDSLDVEADENLRGELEDYLPDFDALKRELSFLRSANTSGRTLLSLPYNTPSTAWVLSLVAYENLMPQHTADAATFKNVWRALQVDDDPPPDVVENTLRDLTALAAYSTRCRGEAAEAANCGVQEVADGSAVFTIMGDWAAPDAQASSDRIAHISFPGTRDKFVYSSDVLVFPKFPADGMDVRKALTNAVTSEATQTEIAIAKGSRRVVGGFPPNAQLDVPPLPASGRIPGMTHIIPRESYNELDQRTAACFWSSSDDACSELAGYMEGQYRSTAPRSKPAVDTSPIITTQPSSTSPGASTVGDPD